MEPIAVGQENKLFPEGLPEQKGMAYNVAGLNGVSQDDYPLPSDLQNDTVLSDGFLPIENEILLMDDQEWAFNPSLGPQEEALDSSFSFLRPLDTKPDSEPSAMMEGRPQNGSNEPEETTVPGTSLKKRKMSKTAQKPVEQPYESYLAAIEKKSLSLARALKPGDLVIIEPAPGADDHGFAFWLAMVLEPLKNVIKRRVGTYDGIYYSTDVEALWIRYLNRRPSKSTTSFFYAAKDLPRYILPFTVRGVVTEAMLTQKRKSKLPSTNQYFALKKKSAVAIEKSIMDFKGQRRLHRSSKTA